MYVCVMHVQCMICSRQMAEEVLRGGTGEVDQSTGFEGMETLARAIELGELSTAQHYTSGRILSCFSAGQSADYSDRHCVSSQL